MVSYYWNGRLYTDEVIVLILVVVDNGLVPNLGPDKYGMFRTS